MLIENLIWIIAQQNSYYACGPMNRNGNKLTSVKNFLTMPVFKKNITTGDDSSIYSYDLKSCCSGWRIDLPSKIKSQHVLLKHEGVLVSSDWET